MQSETQRLLRASFIELPLVEPREQFDIGALLAGGGLER